jgi:hypothetical protein
VYSDLRPIKDYLLPSQTIVYKNVHTSFDAYKELLTTPMRVFSAHFAARDSVDKEEPRWDERQHFSHFGSYQSAADIFEGWQLMDSDTFDLRNSNG